MTTSAPSITVATPPTPAPAPAPSPPVAAPSRSTIVVAFPGGKRVDCTVDGFTVTTDQPVSGGGLGAAPAPFDLFLASLATCAGIFALGFCQARKLSTEGLRVEQDVVSDPVTHLPIEIRLRVTPPAGFPERYRDALLRAVDQCKVKKVMAHPPAFATELVDANVTS